MSTFLHGLDLCRKERLSNQQRRQCVNRRVGPPSNRRHNEVPEKLLLAIKLSIFFLKSVFLSRMILGCFRLGNPDLDLKIWVFSISNPTQNKTDFVTDFNCGKSLSGSISEICDKIFFKFCVRLEI